MGVGAGQTELRKFFPARAVEGLVHEVVIMNCIGGFVVDHVGLQNAGDVYSSPRRMRITTGEQNCGDRSIKVERAAIGRRK